MHAVASSPPAPPPLPGAVVFAYAMTALPLAVVGLPLAIYVLPFFAQERGVPLAQLGLVLTAARMGDVFVDPVIGAASDRLRTRFGRRRPWILVGAPVLMLGTWMLFVPPAGVGAAYLVVWTLVAY